MYRLSISLLLFIAGLFFSIKAAAQICTGSLGAPVVNFTFGAGKTVGAIGPELGKTFTTLEYFVGGCGGEDGQYTLLSSMGTSCKGGTWKYIQHDHTGDPNGYMMIINATDAPSLFFTYNVKGDELCPNTTYQFAAWILNILRDIPSTQGYSEPNITFSIEKTDGTVLKSFNTGNIKADDLTTPSWKQYGTFFTSPADGSDLIVKMTNNASGGLGNDLALDDITFSPCGPLIQTGFTTIGATEDRNNCLNDNLDYTLVAQQTGYPNPTYQWQQNKNDGAGWVDIPGATTTSYHVIIPNAAVGRYQYRIGVLSSSSASEKCRIFSDPLNINVYPIPTYALSATTSACIGKELRLQSSGGDSYLWTGPNNFLSTDNSPVITYNANQSYDGDYKLRIIRNGCPFFATTTVTVYPPVAIDPLQDATICEGTSVHFNVKSANATTFKWYPSDGLDHDDVPNPVANPKFTTTYQVYATNDGCPDVAAIASAKITVVKGPFADAGKNMKMFEGQTAKLNGTVGGDNVQVYWTPADYLDDPTSPTPITSSPSDITYQLHVKSLSGCGESVSSVFVRVYKTLKIVNTFTPNGDGVNDFWDIKNIDDYPKADVSIYTRSGQKVFQSIGYGKPWDGTFNGKIAPSGTYYYIIDLKEDNLPKKSGWVVVEH